MRMEFKTYLLLVSIFSILFMLGSPLTTKLPNATITIPVSSTHEMLHLHMLLLPLGTPPQDIHLIFTTSSSFVLSPCGFNYTYSTSFGIDQKRIPTFYPQMSYSGKPLRCYDPKCRWIIDRQAHCPNCKHGNSSTCLQPCPPYEFEHDKGFIKGTLRYETLNFTHHVMHDFVFGCSESFGNTSPFGSVGFGRGPGSLPSQMGIKMFSYKLCSGIVDPKLLVNSNGKGLSYINFYKVPSTLPPKYKDYYYVILEEIVVGNVVVRVPKKLQVPRPNGHGGTIIDPGAIFTVVDFRIGIFIFYEFEKQMGEENYIGVMENLRCFKVLDTNSFPKLVFRFEGGVNLEVSSWNYFKINQLLGENVYCLTIQRFIDDPPYPSPAVILGGFQQRDTYIEYDLENERLGFRKMNCMSGDEMVLTLWK